MFQSTRIFVVLGFLVITQCNPPALFQRPDATQPTSSQNSGTTIGTENTAGTDTDTGETDTTPAGTDTDTSGSDTSTNETDTDSGGTDTGGTVTGTDGTDTDTDGTDTDTGGTDTGTGGTDTDTGGTDTSTGGTDTGTDNTDGTDTSAGIPADNDGDGFSSTEDCDDNRATITPEATEEFGNGVDENCDGYDFDPETTRVVASDGSQTLPNGRANTSCLITAPCQDFGYVATRVARSGDKIAILSGSYALSRGVSLSKGMTIQGGFVESEDGILADSDESLTTLDFAAGAALTVRNTSTVETRLENLTVTGNPYVSTTGTALISTLNASLSLENVAVSVSDANTEGRGVAFAVNTTGSFAFTMDDSAITIGTITDVGAIATAEGVSISNIGTGSVTATVSNSTINTGLLVKSTTYTNAKGITAENASTGSLTVTMVANTLTISGATINQGIGLQEATGATLKGNTLLIDTGSMLQTGITASGNASSAAFTLRDNMIVATGDASATKAYNIILGDVSATLLNNSIIQNGASETHNLLYSYNALTGKSLDVVNNLFYNENGGSVTNVEIDGTIQTDVTVTTLSTNDFWNVSGDEVSFKTGEIECGNNSDDDGDGNMDCADDDCREDASCAEDCTNSTDDNGNGLADCDDTIYCTEMSFGSFGSGSCRENSISTLAINAPRHTRIDTMEDFINAHGGTASGNMSRDPLFSTSDYTQPMEVAGNSPLVNRGAAHSSIDATADEDAFGNPRVQGSGVDIGAQEVR